jgi:hypothetical protein
MYCYVYLVLVTSTIRTSVGSAPVGFVVWDTYVDRSYLEQFLPHVATGLFLN